MDIYEKNIEQIKKESSYYVKTYNNKKVCINYARIYNNKKFRIVSISSILLYLLLLIKTPGFLRKKNGKKRYFITLLFAILLSVGGYLAYHKIMNLSRNQ